GLLLLDGPSRRTKHPGLDDPFSPVTITSSGQNFRNPHASDQGDRGLRRQMAPGERRAGKEGALPRLSGARTSMAGCSASRTSPPAPLHVGPPRTFCDKAPRFVPAVPYRRILFLPSRKFARSWG